jgi:hypothetical protein
VKSRKSRKSQKSRKSAKNVKSRKSRKSRKSVHAMHDFHITSPLSSPASLLAHDDMSGVSVKDLDAEGTTPEHPDAAASSVVSSTPSE